MNHASKSDWMPGSEKSGHNPSSFQGKNFDINQQGKPVKAVIGVAVLIVLALVLSRMHPVPHEITDPSVTTGQTTGSIAR